ncbi:hypothetical protein G9C98_006719 [Cotesia typhae]|uniref:Uncharacterized protein n=1 Tax=Cotesia typhae TaxID=2053667 RepID=A0A8J5R0U0_9HYME|nr:hypothetical protein G9C98_006719 [Cotesia typhae]
MSEFEISCLSGIWKNWKKFLKVIITPTFPCPEDNIPFNSKALDPASDNGSQVLENKDHIECNPIIIDMYPYDEEISINTCEPITDILETLKSSVQGLAVLYYYKNHRTFNDFYRNLLSDVIVSTEMRTNHSLMITPERLHELALLIPEVCVLELCDTYYVTYSREKKQKNISSRQIPYSLQSLEGHSNSKWINTKL